MIPTLWEAFLKTHKKAWGAFVANTAHPAPVEHFARTLTQIPEIYETPGAE
jgi:hypothetical protein